MKKVMVLLATILLFSGCSGTKEIQNDLLKIRNELSGKEYAFLACIHADFGENTYDFKLDCHFDADGNMTFTVTSPTTISGITGKIDAAGGALTFDDKAVAFCVLADGQVSPVCTPWLVMKALRSGFLSSWAQENGGTILSIDDSFEGAGASFRVLISKQLHPQSAEVLWEGRCILSMTVENFRYL